MLGRQEENGPIPVERVLVTGATGFIGRRLVRALAARGIETFGLVRRDPPDPCPDVVYVHQDLTEAFDPDRLPSRMDAIIHQAALINIDEHDPKQLEAAVVVNVQGTLRLLHFARDTGIEKFLYASTGGVYGSRDTYIDESTGWNPMDFYSVTKCQAELEVAYFAESFSTLILRYFFPYGPGTPNPLENIVRSVIEDESIAVLSTGHPRLNPLHVEDAVEATIRSLHLSGYQVLNIAGEEETSFVDIAERCARILHGPDASPKLQFIDEGDAHPFHRRDALASTDRMQALLNWRPSIRLEQGLRQFVHGVRVDEQ